MLTSAETMSRTEPVLLRRAELNEDSPHRGVLSFECPHPADLAAIERHLTAAAASALNGLGGGRVYLRAAHTTAPGGVYPRRVFIEVHIVDHPHPSSHAPDDPR